MLDEAVAVPRLTGMIVCRNEARRIGACLDSLAFCDELLAIDSGSTDGTLELLQARGIRAISHPWSGMNAQKEYGRSESRGEWLLNLDADEVVTPELRTEILSLLERGGDAGVDAYAIPFRNHFRSVWVRRSGYYPDPHVRLIRRARARWDREAPVHDRVIVEGATGALRGHIDHYSFESIGHFLEKSCAYASAFAAAAHRSGRRAGVSTIALHTLFRFFKAYVLKAGFLEGALGLTISGLQAYEVFQKYVRLWELGRFPDHGGR
jgi:glycosyltransferase involved in cell wall biosynthesis